MADRVNSFEDREAWKSARELVQAVYSVFRRDPASRDFGLRDQAQRAAVSTMTNIAEGFERLHLPEKLQFYNIARASWGEVRSVTYILIDLSHVSADEKSHLQSLAFGTGKLLSGLIHATESRKS